MRTFCFVFLFLFLFCFFFDLEFKDLWFCVFIFEVLYVRLWLGGVICYRSGAVFICFVFVVVVFVVVLFLFFSLRLFYIIEWTCSPFSFRKADVSGRKIGGKKL